MEELQLAITATRVEQRNFGLWIKSWQVGQMLHALVTDKSPAGNLVLRVGGHQITATADIPVQKGAQLMLEVTNLLPTPTLKIVANAATASPLSQALNGQLQLLMPNQGSVVAPFTTLLDPIQGAKILSLLGIRSDAISQLIRSIQKPETLVDPRQLQKALQQSGFFLESQLRQLVLSGGVMPQGDIKAELLKILDRVNRKLSKPAGEEKEGDETKADSDALLVLKNEVEGGLATITLHQLASYQQAESGTRSWAFEVPFNLHGATEVLSMQIERDDQSPLLEGQISDAEQGWKVLLSMQLSRLGGIETELFLSGNRVSAVIYSEQDRTANVIDNELQALQMGLESRGLDVSILRSHQGRRVDNSLKENNPNANGLCLDERV